MDRFRVKSRAMSSTPTTSLKCHGSLQKEVNVKHKKNKEQSKALSDTTTAATATTSLQLLASGLLEPSILPTSSNNWGLVRVYFGCLSPDRVYKTVLVNSETTAKDVVTMVFESLHRLPKDTAAEDLSLQEMQESSQGSYYRVLSDSECPLVNQSRWDDPSLWSFRLSWRSKQTEKKQTRMPTRLTPAFSTIDPQCTKSLEESMSTPRDHNINNAPLGRHGTSCFCGHSRTTLKSPPLELSQEQQRQYIEISRSISSPERQVSCGCNCRLRAEREEEETEEEVVIIDMQEEEGGGTPIYQNLLPVPKEKNLRTNSQEFSLGKDTQQLSGERSSRYKLIASPNSNYSNANLNRIPGSHIVKRQKSASAHTRRLVISGQRTVNSVLATEPAHCPSSASDSFVTQRQAGVVQEEKYTLLKRSPGDQHQLSLPAFAAQGTKTSVLYPSSQERWLTPEDETSAALQMGMSSVMQQVNQEGGHTSAKKSITPGHWHSMNSYPRKERHQGDCIRHVRELHPAIPEDEICGKCEGEVTQTGGVPGDAGAAAVLYKRRVEDVANRGSTVQGCNDERDPNGFDLDTFSCATGEVGDGTGITHGEKGMEHIDDSTSDSVVSLSPHELSYTSSCQTPSDLQCSTDEGISFANPILCSESSIASAHKGRLCTKQRIEEVIEFEEEVVIISFLDDDCESVGSTSGRSNKCAHGKVSHGLHGSSPCGSHRSTDCGSVVKADCGTHTTDATTGEQSGCTTNHWGPTHELNDGTGREAVGVELEDNIMPSISPIHALGDGGVCPEQSKGTSPDGRNASKTANMSSRTEISSAGSVAATNTAQAISQSCDTIKTKLELVCFSSPTSFNLPLSKRDMDVDSDFILWDGSDTGFIDDDDDFLLSKSTLDSQHRSLSTSPITASTNTSTGCFDLSLIDSSEFFSAELLSPGPVVTRFTAEAMKYWEKEDEVGDIESDCDEYCNDEQEELTSPDDVPLQLFLAPEKAGICWTQSQHSQLQALGSGSGVNLRTLLMEEESARHWSFRQLYVIREEPLVEEIEEREYMALQQALWEAEEEEEEGSNLNDQGLTVEDGQSSTERSLVHLEGKQRSLQELSEFLKIPCHLLVKAELPRMSDPLQSVNDNIKDGDSEMYEREGMDDALEEAMALEFDVDQILLNGDPVSPWFQNEKFGSGSVGSEERPLSCERDYQLELHVQHDCSSTGSGDKPSKVQKSSLQGHVCSSMGTPAQMHAPEESGHSQEAIRVESYNRSNVFDATCSSVAETVRAACIMPCQQFTPADTSLPNHSGLALSPRDRALGNVSAAAVKRKPLGSVGMSSISPHQNPPPVSHCRTPQTTMNPSSFGWEDRSSLPITTTNLSFDKSGNGGCHANPTTKVVRRTHTEV